MTELENTLTENQKDMHRLNNLIGAIPASNYLFMEFDRCKAIALTLGMVKEA